MKAKWILLMASMLFLTACEHTVQGMKQDFRANTGSTTKTTVVKKSTVVYPSQAQSGPTSPPPLETPPQ